MKFSPVAAFGAMSYTIGKFGIHSLFSLGKMMGSVYLTMALFIIVVLGTICKLYGFSIFKLLRFIKEELLLVLGTSSSESALPRIMEKLEKFGASKPVVGLGCSYRVFVQSGRHIDLFIHGRVIYSPSVWC